MRHVPKVHTPPTYYTVLAMFANSSILQLLAGLHHESLSIFSFLFRLSLQFIFLFLFIISSIFFIPVLLLHGALRIGFHYLLFCICLVSDSLWLSWIRLLCSCMVFSCFSNWQESRLCHHRGTVLLCFVSKSLALTSL